MSNFYLFFDKETGVVKAVSPIVIDEFAHHSHFAIDINMANEFMTGTRIASDWYVVTGADGSPSLNKNALDWFVVTDENGEQSFSANGLDSVPTLGGEFVLIDRADALPSASQSIQVTVYAGSGTLEVSIPNQFIGMELVHIRTEEMIFRLTKRNDPSIVVTEMVVDIEKLMKEGVVRIPFTSKLKDFSVFTQRVFRHYTMTVKSSSWVPALSRNGKVNKLVSFKSSNEIPNGFQGIVATHKENQLLIEIVGDEDFIYASFNEKPRLFLTRLNDPTVFVGMVKYNFDVLLAEKSVKIKLDPSVGVDFGISGYPITDNMILIRKD